MSLSRAVGGGLIAVLLMMLSITASPIAAGTDTTYRIPDRIDRTGKADVTVPMQQFLTSVPDGSVIEFPRGARYRIEGTLEIRDGRDLTFEGNGATIFATTKGDRERSQLRIVGGSGIVFRELVVRGAHPSGGVGDDAYQEDLEAQHGFEILAVRDLELDRVTVTDVYGDFVYVGPNSRLTWSENIWIHDSTFARNGRQGIAVTAGRNVVIERNHLSQTRRSTFDLEPNTERGGAEQIHILNNRVGVGRLLFLASHGDGPVNDVVVSGNKLTAHVLSIDIVPPENQRRARFWITGNVSSTPAESRAMRLSSLDGVVIRDNTQPVERPDEIVLELNDVCGARIGRNDFGRSAEPLMVSGAQCAAPISTRVPLPPPVTGRDAVTDGERAGEPPRTSSRAGDGGSEDGQDVRTIALIGSALVVVGALAIVGARRGIRARRS